ncbi:hypothetical protein CSUI_007660 [Cystoisospora suis]|uniref:Uncharacterized protein n=1 Tax=Cystoisospora suis TaxID=483139 RepID=A0A2C6KQ73_9APIC|nr:hypothetical protein CSUI_007660 [Cystoisospora suis]
MERWQPLQSIQGQRKATKQGFEYASEPSSPYVTGEDHGSEGLPNLALETERTGTAEHVEQDAPSAASQGGLAMQLPSERTATGEGTQIDDEWDTLTLIDEGHRERSKRYFSQPIKDVLQSMDHAGKRSADEFDFEKLKREIQPEVAQDDTSTLTPGRRQAEEAHVCSSLLHCTKAYRRRGQSGQGKTVYKSGTPATCPEGGSAGGPRHD